MLSSGHGVLPALVARPRGAGESSPTYATNSIRRISRLTNSGGARHVSGLARARRASVHSPSCRARLSRPLRFRLTQRHPLAARAVDLLSGAERQKYDRERR